MTHPNIRPISAQSARSTLESLEENVSRVIHGKADAIRKSILGLLTGGHLLFEDVPGVGKTTLAQALARSVNLSFQRVQCTSDMLPADILGVTIFDNETHAFVLREGPIFANVVVIDEINRTTPKTQSALLQAMASAQVSIDRTTYDLPRPFMVMATQNPVETHGTFPLPNSQLDRFLMRLHLGYPDAEYERTILTDHRRTDDYSMIQTLISSEDLLGMQEGVRKVRVEETIVDYIQRIVQATREDEMIEQGVSTRGALALRNCTQAYAYLNGRDYTIPDDVKSIGVPVLAHRLSVAAGYGGTNGGIGVGNSVVDALLEQVPVPI